MLETVAGRRKDSKRWEGAKRTRTGNAPALVLALLAYLVANQRFGALGAAGEGSPNEGSPNERGDD